METWIESLGTWLPLLVLKTTSPLFRCHHRRLSSLVFAFETFPSSRRDNRWISKDRFSLSSLDLSLLLLTVHPLTLKDNQTLFMSDFLLSYSRVNITHIHILHVNLMIIGKASSNFVTEAAALFLPSNHHQDPVCLSRYPSDNLARGSSGTERKRKRERERVCSDYLTSRQLELNERRRKNCELTPEVKTSFVSCCR